VATSTGWRKLVESIEKSAVVLGNVNHYDGVAEVPLPALAWGCWSADKNNPWWSMYLVGTCREMEQLRKN
jgi:hypothetical protein